MERQSGGQRTRVNFAVLSLAVVAMTAGATYLAIAIQGSRKQALSGSVTRSHLGAIKAALANYHSDLGRYPRLTPTPTTASDGPHYDDDAIALFAALRNTSAEAGSGTDSPYLPDWRPDYTGLLQDRAQNAATKMGSDGERYCEALTEAEATETRTLAYQRAHLPHDPSHSAPVLIDPWGQPYHYREWASVAGLIKERLVNSPATRVVRTPEGGTRRVADFPHTPDGFDLWSGGRNGINEFGDPDSDDVTSWDH